MMIAKPYVAHYLETNNAHLLTRVRHPPLPFVWPYLFYHAIMDFSMMACVF